MSKPKKEGYNFRSDTGRFTTEQYAKKHPDTTEKEKISKNLVVK
jgi:hypothetical protein